MLGINLEFAAGTAEDTKKVILGLFDPKQLLDAYKQACREHNTRDIMLVCLDAKRPYDLFAGPRASMRLHLAGQFKFTMALDPAHRIVQAPLETDAFWVFVPIPQVEMPIMCVVFALPYEQELVGAAN